ncbi:hypothetical protein L3X38_021453 [Prunus dulcis]|uniref:Uncharacterized protein n=1 Tax=Prunus dulcis TaxID=3755 RepID=A0AAD4Z2L2_PRUDU|nr:hypothetical protein L3X38_021453 [Prunus dulcis]
MRRRRLSENLRKNKGALFFLLAQQRLTDDGDSGSFQNLSDGQTFNTSIPLKTGVLVQHNISHIAPLFQGAAATSRVALSCLPLLSTFRFYY